MKKTIKEPKKTFGIGELSITNKNTKKENGTFEFIASGIKEDRYGEVIEPEGWDFKAYKKNPVMLWAHDHKTPAIARIYKIWKDAKQVYAKAEWAPTPLAQEIRQLVEAGFIKAVSVGFLPREWEGEWPNYKYTDQELLEVSVVNVPAYAEALMTNAKDMGLKTVVKALEGDRPKKQVKKEKSSIEVVEISTKDKKIILHDESGKRQSFDLTKEAELPKVKEPILESINKKLVSFDEKMSEIQASLKGKESGRTGKTKKAEKYSDEDLLKIADKAIEIFLLRSRKK